MFFNFPCNENKKVPGEEKVIKWSSCREVLILDESLFAAQWHNCWIMFICSIAGLCLTDPNFVEESSTDLPTGLSKSQIILSSLKPICHWNLCLQDIIVHHQSNYVVNCSCWHLLYFLSSKIANAYWTHKGHKEHC